MLCVSSVGAQNRYENRPLAEPVDITFEGNDRDLSAAEQFRLIARNTLGTTYSSLKIRETIQAIYDTKKVVSVTVEASETGGSAVRLRFIIKRKTQAERVSVVVGNTIGDKVTEDELLFRLNLVTPGSPVTDQILQANAGAILEYLRERGFYKSEVVPSQKTSSAETRVGVVFTVTPNEQAKVGAFKIDIQGFDVDKVRSKLKLRPGEYYSREKLNQDVERIRKALRDEDFFAPELSEPRVVFENDTNTINLELTGKVGPTIKVTVEAKNEKVGEGTQTRLLPIKREGTLDFSAIVEGERRLENYFQEQGYFFADVTPVCSVQPALTEAEASYTVNETNLLCASLSGADLTNRTVEVKYQADLNRQLKLVDIRIEGTNRLPIEEIKTVLESQEASLLGIIPFLGYGRGYTSQELLAEDVDTIKSLMRELGYRRADVRVRQGVSPTGDNLIITFVVDEGKPTRIDDVAITGNTAFSAATLKTELPNLVGQNYSRAKIRNGQRKLAEYYSNQGFYDAKINYDIEESGSDDTEDRVKVIYKVENEGKKVFINRILIYGIERTKRESILKAINLRSGQTLRAADIFSSEQNLYATDAFKRVEIKPEPAGENPDGSRLTDVIINVEEQAPRLLTYGGGFSTDAGPFGFFDIRHYNLFGNLQQGGARVRISRLQQLAGIDFINPRFLRDGRNADGTQRFAPLTFTAQYQRDSTVTRFFRSVFDKGTFGIVQRIDANGNPIDEFGNNTGSPTINRLTLSAETSRTISVKNRSILFARYKFEDVRLFNVESLLIKDLLVPDARIRTSGFGATFVRDTRENCTTKYTLLEIISRGEPGDPCRYNPGDPTKGEYLTAEYNVSVPFLGANIGFQKFQASYYRFYTVPFLKNTTFAGRAVLGLANVFAKGNRFSPAQFPGLEGILPISERFFAGGSTSLRGFDFESAGPRVVIVPQGIFRNSQGQIVSLQPFTVPFGGNALAIVNLEARVPLTKSVRAVPFYDGGNVFRRVGDIFKSTAADPNDVFGSNFRSVWSHTVGLGLRLKTPIGGEFGVDYGYLFNPPRFLIPQPGNAPNAIYQVRREQLHFRFSQAF
ncbi:MAG: BamA/TamA family outer membrane protein [Acidobacteria bacterium]|nr:BamA/TamA family outer membrane protein [Acidobacteriota bacterium]